MSGDVEAIAAAVDARDMDRAIGLAQTAYGRGSRNPLVLNLTAYQLELEDRLDDALKVLEEAGAATPDDPFIWNSIGVCHSKADRPFEALKAFNVFTRKYFFPLCSDYPCYSGLPSADPAGLPVAARAVREVLCLPIYGTLPLDAVHRICDMVMSLQGAAA